MNFDVITAFIAAMAIGSQILAIVYISLAYHLSKRKHFILLGSALIGMAIRRCLAFGTVNKAAETTVIIGEDPSILNQLDYFFLFDAGIVPLLISLAMCLACGMMYRIEKKFNEKK